MRTQAGQTLTRSATGVVLQDCAAAAASVGFGINSFVHRIRRLAEASGRLENLPYTILGGLMLVSLVARLVLILS